MSYEVGPEREVHLGPALSPADLVAALFFETMMRIDPLNPRWDLALVCAGYLLGSP